MESHILHFAQREFVEKGLSGARMQSIADAAEVNKALLHYYFRSKEQLYDAALAALFQELWQDLLDQFRQIETHSSLEDKIRLLVHSYLQALATRPLFAQLLLRELADQGRHLPQILHKTSNLIGQISCQFQQSLQEESAQAQWAPIPLMQLMMNVMGMVLGPFLLRPMFDALSQTLALENPWENPAWLCEREKWILQTLFEGIKEK